MISGNMVGSYSQIGKTFILVDENGTELTGVCVDNLQVFDATTADVKIGKTFASDEGVLVGIDTKTYRTEQGCIIIPAGKEFTIPFYEYSLYDYTKLQCIIAPYNISPYSSVAADKVVIGDSVYAVCSTEKLSDVTKDEGSQSIKLNIVNDSELKYVIHYFAYREEV